MKSPLSFSGVNPSSNGSPEKKNVEMELNDEDTPVIKDIISPEHI